jgi:iron complex transport system ATP-binding protein
MTLLSMQNIAVTRGKARVLDGVSLSLSSGTLTALIGPNGSGKTTLLRAAMELIPATGSVAWNDVELSRYRRAELSQLVAYLPQGSTWLPGQTVEATLRSGRAIRAGPFGFESALDVQVVQELAERLLLTDLLARPMSSLSGGQQQRVLLGRCLAQQPKALLLDEPATFLDLRFQVEVYSLVRDLVRRDGLGVLMASHDLNLAGEFADQVVLLREGKVVASGEPSQVIRAHILSDVFGVKMAELRDGRGRYVVAPVV